MSEGSSETNRENLTNMESMIQQLQEDVAKMKGKKKIQKQHIIIIF